jgi:hypothetical protein
VAQPSFMVVWEKNQRNSEEKILEKRKEKIQQVAL